MYINSNFRTINISSTFKNKQKPAISIFLAILSIYLLDNFIAARAQLITFIIFLLEVYFIEMFLQTKKKKICYWFNNIANNNSKCTFSSIAILLLY